MRFVYAACIPYIFQFVPWALTRVLNSACLCRCPSTGILRPLAENRWSALAFASTVATALASLAAGFLEMKVVHLMTTNATLTFCLCTGSNCFTIYGLSYSTIFISFIPRHSRFQTLPPVQPPVIIRKFSRNFKLYPLFMFYYNSIAIILVREQLHVLLCTVNGKTETE